MKKAPSKQAAPSNWVLVAASSASAEQEEPEADVIARGVAYALRRQGWREVAAANGRSALWLRVLRGHAFILHGDAAGHDIDTIQGRHGLAREAHDIASREVPHAELSSPVLVAARAVALATGDRQPWSALRAKRGGGEAWWDDVLWGLVHRAPPLRRGVHEAPRWSAWGTNGWNRTQAIVDRAHGEAFHDQVDWLMGGG